MVVVSTAVSDGVISSPPLPATRLDPPPRSFNLVATGDVLTESVVNDNAALAAGPGARFDSRPLFAPITTMLSGADIAICHMEMPIGAPGERPGVYGHSPFGGNLILAPYEIAAGLRRAGFDRCSSASNHSYDLAETGIASTLAALDAVGISHVGTARFPSESALDIVTVNGVRLAHLAYTRYSNTVLPRDPWRVELRVVTRPGRSRRQHCSSRRRGGCRRQPAPVARVVFPPPRPRTVNSSLSSPRLLTSIWSSSTVHTSSNRSNESTEHGSIGASATSSPVWALLARRTTTRGRLTGWRPLAVHRSEPRLVHRRAMASPALHRALHPNGLRTNNSARRSTSAARQVGAAGMSRSIDAGRSRRALAGLVARDPGNWFLAPASCGANLTLTVFRHDHGHDNQGR